MLHSRKRDTGDSNVMCFRERLCRRTVAAANVADHVARREVEPVGDQVDQRSGGILGSLVAGLPIAVVQVLAPDLAIELIECVVMCCHILRGLFAVRMYHLGLQEQTCC